MAKKETRHSELASESQNIDAPYELPEGWKWVRLGDVCEKIKRGKSPKYTDKSKILVFAQKCNQPDGTMSLEKALFLNEELLSKYKDDDFVKDGDILINSTGTGTIGRVGYFDKALLPEGMKLVPDTHVTTVRACADNASKFFYYFIKQKESYLELKGVGTTNMKELHADVLENLSFPLPPTLAEQQRIVNRIETMFAKLDEAKEKAQSVLDSFETRKAAILHKAFSGQLRIDNGELTIEDWEDTTIGECIKLFSGQDFKPEDYNAEENGIPYITGASNFAENHVLINRWTSKPSVIAKKDDVLLVCKGSGYGKTIIADFEEAHIARQIMALRIPKNISNRFILYFLQNNYEYLRNGGQGLIPGIARNIVLQMPIKVPPLNYQLSIVNFLDSVLEKESRAKEAAQTVLDQIALLKKSILARAFRGEL